MKNYILSFVLCAIAHPFNIYAAEVQADTVQAEKEQTEIRISPSFQRELMNAFSFAPMEAPLTSPSVVPLDRSLMKEWLSAIPIKAEIKPLDLPGVITKSTGINPYLWQWGDGKYGILQRADGTQCLSGLDVNALGRFIRPNEIKLRKMEELANGARDVMDRCYPQEGLATPVPSDTARIDNE